MGDNLKVVWAEFSTLSKAVFVMSAITWHIQEHPHLELKIRPGGQSYETFYGRNL
jgi:hypothetical protein